MKFFVMIAAGLLSAAALAPTAAVAAPVAGTTVAVQSGERVVVRERTTTRRHWSNNDRRGHRWGTRKVCKRTWYHGRKITRCRTVRYRR